MFNNNNLFRNVRRWNGTGYRVETETQLDEGTTAADVLKYESEELQNHYDLDLPSGIMLYLKNVPASDLIWVCQRKEDAEIYGNSEEDVIIISDIHGGRILADDGDGGSLILRLKD